MNIRKLAIITTHPIQYYAPLFKILSERQNISIKVFYTWGLAALDKFDPGFNKRVRWDIPLLDGYPYQWVVNTSKNPGSNHFKGIVNPNLISELEKLKPDALLVFGWAYHGHLAAIRYFSGKIPVYFRGDSTLLDDQKNIRSPLRAFFLRWVYRHVDHAFYTGSNNKSYYLNFGLQNCQLSFAPHAVDNDRFSYPQTAKVAKLKEDLGIPAGESLLLYAGKFEEKKDPELLLNAFLQLALPGWHLLFVGNGTLEIKLKQNAAENRYVHFMEFQNQLDMPAIYQACDLFCLPSKGPGESWGLSVNEAMACGKAIIASSKTGCAADLVKEGNNGAVFASGNIDQLKEKLRHLTQNESRLRAYGRHSAELIADWNFNKIAQSIENKLNNEEKRQD